MGEWSCSSCEMDYENLTYDGDVGHQSVHPIYGLFLPITYCVTCAVGLLGNVLVIVVYVFYRKKKTLTDAFFLNLAVADVSFLCTLPFLVCQLLHEWIFGDFMCKMVIGMYRVNLYTSMLTLTAITFDRFVSIVKVTKAQKYHQHKHRWGGGMCAGIWLIAVLLATPQFKFSADQGNSCSEHHESPERMASIYSIQLVVGFFLPMSAMIFCYSFILNTVIGSRSLQKKKSIRIILTLVVVFLVTQLPFNVTLLVVLHRPEDVGLWDVASVLEAVAYLHACLNPVLYFFVGTKFRNSFWKTLRDFRLATGREEPSRGTEGSSKPASGSTHMEAFSLAQT